MADDIHSANEELNLKKKRTTNREVRCDVFNPTRRIVLATGEFYRGVAEAIAAGLRSFNEVLDTEESSKDLPTAFVDGVAEANARFHEEMASTTRRAVERLKTERQEPSTVVVGLDYEKLARMVAAELRKSGTPPGSSAPDTSTSEPLG
jgi:hypothetical protein